jgi:hypothetical protein
VKGGLIPAAQETRTVVQGTSLSTANAQCAAGGAAASTCTRSASRPAPLRRASRCSMSEVTGATSGLSDLDLVVIKGSTVVGSGGDTANESVQLLNPAAGDYKVCVIGYAPRGGSASYALSSWLVNSASTGGNFKVNVPSSATIGGTASVGMSWSGLATGKRYVGAVNFLLGGVKQGTTVIDVDTTDPCRCSRTRSKKTALAF